MYFNDLEIDILSVFHDIKVQFVKEIHEKETKNKFRGPKSKQNWLRIISDVI